MTTTDTASTTTGTLRPLTPEEIGALVRIVRTMQGWTQETLAELSDLQTRTIQRVEQGQPSSLDTRRALARGFGLENIDHFNALRSFPTEEELQKQKEAFDREHLLLDARQVDGRQLLALMQDGPCFCAICAMSVAQLPHAAQDAFAAITDFVRDCMDIFDVASRTEILSYGDTLDESIAELKSAGFCLCAAFRDTKLTNDKWVDKTPLACRITYLLAAPKDQPRRRSRSPGRCRADFERSSRADRKHHPSRHLRGRSSGGVGPFRLAHNRAVGKLLCVAVLRQCGPVSVAACNQPW